VSAELAEHIRQAAEAEDRSVSWLLKQSAKERLDRAQDNGSANHCTCTEPITDEDEAHWCLRCRRRITQTKGTARHA
jgi:uncharacterized paraquat-inducible protein A